MTKKQKSLLTRIILGIVLFLAGMILERAVDAPWAYLTAVGLLLMSWLLCGLEIAIKAVKNIGHGQIFDENFLMTLATVGAFALMDFDEGAAVMLFFQVGELFQSIAVERSRRSVAALMDLRPDVALVLRDGEPEECDPEEVEAGDLLRVLPGQRIPVDGVVVEGSSSVDTAKITGSRFLPTPGTGSCPAASTSPAFSPFGRKSEESSHRGQDFGPDGIGHGGKVRHGEPHHPICPVLHPLRGGWRCDSGSAAALF